ncbi:terminase large subunit domain-containing protein [Pontibacter rugosus]
MKKTVKIFAPNPTAVIFALKNTDSENWKDKQELDHTTKGKELEQRVVFYLPDNGRSKRVSPQEGFQEDFLSSAADIVIGGGAAGVGKTYALLMEGGRHIDNSGFGAVIFRRTSPQIRMEGGLWDTSLELYIGIGGSPKETTLDWKFPSGASVGFSHLQYENDKLNFQGSQIAMIGFDELTHFSESTFFYMLSRNRSTCGVEPYVRATCNPDPDSWVASFIDWWIDQEEKLPDGSPNPTYGLPIVERAGKVRYFTKDGDSIVWGDTAEEVVARCPHIFKGELANVRPKSVTFIPGSIYQNKELLSVDPGYLANLMAQDEATRASLLDGNWKIKLDGFGLFDYQRIYDMYTNEHAEGGKGYITIDAARFGSDLAVIWVWDGWRIVDLAWFPKSSTKDIADKVKEFEKQYKVPRSQTVCDADGVGGGVIDQCPGMQSFVNNAAPLPNPNGPKDKKGQPVKENYDNLKTQCFYMIADKVNAAAVYVPDGIAERRVGKKKVREYFNEELRAIKKANTDSDGKKGINSKEQQKNILRRSPDFADAFALRCFFELHQVKRVKSKTIKR